MGRRKSIDPWEEVKLAYVRAKPKIGAKKLHARFPQFRERHIEDRIWQEKWGKAREEYWANVGVSPVEVAKLDTAAAVDWIARQREAKERHYQHLRAAEIEAAAAFLPNAKGKTRKLTDIERSMAVSTLAKAIASEEAVLAWEVSSGSGKPSGETISTEQRERLGRIFRLLRGPAKELPGGA